MLREPIAWSQENFKLLLYEKNSQNSLKKNLPREKWLSPQDIQIKEGERAYFEGSAGSLLSTLGPSEIRINSEKQLVLLSGHFWIRGDSEIMSLRVPQLCGPLQPQGKWSGIIQIRPSLFLCRIRLKEGAIKTTQISAQAPFLLEWNDRLQKLSRFPYDPDDFQNQEEKLRWFEKKIPKTQQTLANRANSKWTLLIFTAPSVRRYLPAEGSLPKQFLKTQVLGGQFSRAFRMKSDYFFRLGIESNAQTGKLELNQDAQVSSNFMTLSLGPQLGWGWDDLEFSGSYFQIWQKNSLHQLGKNWGYSFEVAYSGWRLSDLVWLQVGVLSYWFWQKFRLHSQFSSEQNKIWKTQTLGLKIGARF